MTLAVNLPQINASCLTTASRYFHTHTGSRTGVMISHTHGGWNRHYYPQFKDEKSTGWRDSGTCPGLQNK